MCANKTTSNDLIAINRRARYEYHIEKNFEAGLVLQGWEVKSLRAKRVQLNEAYVLLKNQEAWLIGCHITPLPTVSTHIVPDPTRTRKLLLTQRELTQLFGSIERRGYTAIPLRLYWKQRHAKIEIALAQGKKNYDKRAQLKERALQREQEHLKKIR
jgi:SsrA-binding protein